MGFFKVLGGVLAGIGAFVALPIAGPIGAVTMLGAVVGGSLGGVAGAIASAKDENEKVVARKEGEATATTRYALEVEKLKNAIMEYSSRLKDNQAYFELIVALFAVGLAAANADGKITSEEVEELNEFVAGIAHSNLPPNVKNNIQKLRDNPPSFGTAVQLVKKLKGQVDLGMFESVIRIVAMADGTFCRDERAFLEAFKREVA